MFRDFLAEDDITLPQSSGRDFLQQEAPESFSTAARQAPGRVLEDLSNTAYGAVQKIPELFGAAKKEIPGLINPLNLHPQHRALQALAGANEAINSLAQMPLNLSRCSAAMM